MKRPEIKVLNLNKSYRLNEAFIKKIISHILNFLTTRQGAELEVIFLDNASIKALNKRYKRSNRPTDVLSFKIDRKEFGEKKFLGEIFISLDAASKNSRIFRTSLENEITLYIIHGILHLFGYDDEKPKDRARMSRSETRILRYLCTKENLSKVLMPR